MKFVEDFRERPGQAAGRLVAERATEVLVDVLGVHVTVLLPRGVAGRPSEQATMYARRKPLTGDSVSARAYLFCQRLSRCETPA